jgi:hypothetical protein
MANPNMNMMSAPGSGHQQAFAPVSSVSSVRGMQTEQVVCTAEAMFGKHKRQWCLFGYCTIY